MASLFGCQMCGGNAEPEVIAIYLNLERIQSTVRFQSSTSGLENKNYQVNTKKNFRKDTHSLLRLNCDSLQNLDFFHLFVYSFSLIYLIIYSCNKHLLIYGSVLNATKEETNQKGMGCLLRHKVGTKVLMQTAELPKLRVVCRES